jgi:hypothetical protein
VWRGEGVDVAGFFQGFDGGDVLEDVPTKVSLNAGRGGEWWRGGT